MITIFKKCLWKFVRVFKTCSKFQKKCVSKIIHNFNKCSPVQHVFSQEIKMLAIIPQFASVRRVATVYQQKNHSLPASYCIMRVGRPISTRQVCFASSLTQLASNRRSLKLKVYFFSYFPNACFFEKIPNACWWRDSWLRSWPSRSGVAQAHSILSTGSAIIMKPTQLKHAPRVHSAGQLVRNQDGCYYSAINRALLWHIKPVVMVHVQCAITRTSPTRLLYRSTSSAPYKVRLGCHKKYAWLHDHIDSHLYNSYQHTKLE